MVGHKTHTQNNDVILNISMYSYSNYHKTWILNEHEYILHKLDLISKKINSLILKHLPKYMNERDIKTQKLLF